LLALAPESDALRAVETPALVLDHAALEQNIAAMAAFARQAGVALRPHAKTHKSPDIAALQVGAGAGGIACATIAEAEALAAAGIGGLLITTPVLGEVKVARVANLNRIADVTVVVDHIVQVECLRDAIEAGDRTLRVVVDVDVGQARTGVTQVADVLRLVEGLAKIPQLSFAGIQGYAGHAQHILDPAERAAAARAAAATLGAVSEALAKTGRPPPLITGSGTGTHLRDAAGPYTELQPGSYVFMDADYASVLDEAGAAPPFTPSLFVLATVVSVNRPGQVTVDAGTKALATNGPPPRHLIGVGPGASYRFAGDEHGIIAIPAGQESPRLGARLLIGATHCDPTVNLHASYCAVRDGVAMRWPIRGRYGD
jgi:D-serine deaminase-like pyridoxal phosphate-dependent protein